MTAATACAPLKPHPAAAARGGGGAFGYSIRSRHQVRHLRTGWRNACSRQATASVAPWCGLAQRLTASFGEIEAACRARQAQDPPGW